jgi:uncharacterized protein
MRIAVISDVHDNIWALEDVLNKLRDCDVLLCLGDVCSPFTYDMILERFIGPVHFIWGNNDGDRLLIIRKVDQASRATLHGDCAELQLGGRTLFLTHYPVIGRAVAAGGTYDLVCCGHNHSRNTSWVGKTLLLNPGEVMGRFGVHSAAIYDTELGDAEIVTA